MVAFQYNLGDGTKYSDVLERFHYDPYGRPYFLDKDSNLRQDGQSAYDWNILYGGYEYEPQTGLYHVRHRIYHPTLNLWLQPDPQGYADGLNLYQYVRSNPASLTDPSGELIPLVIGMLALGLPGVAAAHYGANEMTAGVDAGDAERYHRGQWFFGAGVGLTGAAITMPLAAAGGMAAGGLGLAKGSLAYGVTAGVVGGAVEGAVGGTLAGGLTAYGFGADAGGVAAGAAWGAGIGGLTGAAFGAGFGAAGWGMGRYVLNPGGTLDSWLRAGVHGGMRRNVLAWRMNRFRLGSTRFYSVQDAANATRLAAGGRPWPTQMERANLGPGLYTWARRSEAVHYLSRLQERRVVDRAILAFRVHNRALGGFRTLDLRTLGDDAANAWMELFSQYGQGLPHRYHHVIRQTGLGVTEYGLGFAEHYFSASVYHALMPRF